MSTAVHLRLGGDRRCTLLVGRGVLDLLESVWQPGWSEAAVIGDDNVLSLYGAAVAERLRARARRVMLQGFPPGEANKTRQTKELIEDALLERGLDRQGCIVALGGGVSLDLAGFVAATYLRGIPYLSLPTSLLAQVDAAVGGKTGVNTPRGKNLVGAFHQPQAVLADSEVLATLPPGEWGNGLAEMVKHAAIADRELLGWMEQNVTALHGPGPVLPHAIRRCIQIKAQVVEKDEREAGLRRVLNFGHTIGHALEGAAAAGHTGPLAHGRAVALGMMVEGRVAEGLCGLPGAERLRLEALLRALHLDLTLPPLSFEQLLPFLQQDKKRSDKAVRLALPRRLGEMAGAGEGYALPVDLKRLRQAWDQARG